MRKVCNYLAILLMAVMALVIAVAFGFPPVNAGRQLTPES